MSKSTCRIQDCDKPSRARRMCEAHYRRWRAYGDAEFLHSAECVECGEIFRSKNGNRSRCSDCPTGKGYISPSRRGECSGCGKFVQLGSTSLADPVCLECRRAAWGSPPTKCAYCDVAFTSRRRESGWTRTCSKSCAVRLQMRDNPDQFQRVRDLGNIARWNVARLSDDERAERAEQKSRLRRARLAGVESEPYTRAEIAERDGFRCGLCRRKVNMDLVHPDPRSASVDHIVPLSKGGEDTRRNVQLAHLICNLRAGSKFEYAQQLLIG